MSRTSVVIKWVEAGRLLNNTPQCPGRPLTETGLAPMSPVPRKRPFYMEKRGLFEELKINFKKGHGGSTGNSTGCLLGAPLRGPEPSSRSSPGQSLSPPGQGINTRARLGGPTGQVHTVPGRQHMDVAN